MDKCKKPTPIGRSGGASGDKNKVILTAKCACGKAIQSVKTFTYKKGKRAAAKQSGWKHI